MEGVFISTIEPRRIFYEKTIIVKNTQKFNSFSKEKKELIIYESPDKNINNSKLLNITDIEWEKSKVGNKNTSENYIDENIRNSYYSKYKVHLYIKNEKINGLLDVVFNNDKFKLINYQLDFINEEYQPWKMLRYDQEGFFKRHSDGISDENHFATAIIIPPLNLNEYKGGELILYKDNKELIIEPYENEWKLVVFGLEIEHELKPIISGQRIVFVCPLKFTNEMKYINNTSVYSELISLKIDKKLVKSQKKSILNKIKKLEVEIDNYREILKIYDNNQNYILHELINDILDQLKKENRNGFIVALNNFYHKPIPSELKMKDIIVYNTIINYFKEQNIKIRILNFACTSNEADESSIQQKKFNISLSTNCEGYESKNDEDIESKFVDYEIICPQKFYDTEYIGDLINQVSQYNDQTYDNLLILNGTFLLCSLDNIYFDESNIIYYDSCNSDNESSNNSDNDSDNE